MDNVNLDTTIEELSNSEKLSTRATNICRSNKLNNLYLILDHYVSNDNFLDMRNCDKHTNTELAAISRKYLLLHPFQNAVINDPPGAELVPLPVELPKKEQLSHLQISILTNVIHIKLKSLSSRFNNALRNFLEDEISFDTFDRQVLSIPNLRMIDIKGMGERSFIELKYLTNVINHYIDIITLFNDTELLRELYVTSLQRFYGIEEADLQLFTSDYDFSQGIPIFKSIFYLTRFRNILSHSERSLFFNDNFRYIDFSADHFSVKLSECSLSRERIRQINKILPSKLHDNIKKIFKEDFLEYQLNTYSCKQHSYFIHVDNKLLQWIQTSEKVPFTKQFVTFVFAALYEDTHFMLGDVGWFYPSYRKRYFFEWKSFYLISRRLEKIFNFREFVLYLSKLIAEEKLVELIKITNFRPFLKQFFFTKRYHEMDRIAAICESIIHDEFPDLINMVDGKNRIESFFSTIVTINKLYENKKYKD